MLDKNKIKFINSLKKKKFREESGYFIVEGDKLVNELLSSSLEIESVLGLSPWLNRVKRASANVKEIIAISEAELNRISSLTTPNQVLAVAKMPQYSYQIEEISSRLSLVLDNLQDPGNLGTIMRLADWFGIEHIFCSPNSVDVYNPKVVQATMGAIFRIQVHYTPLIELMNYFTRIPGFKIYGTFLEGNNIYEKDLEQKGLIVMGNESQGISAEIGTFINEKLFIPSFTGGRKTSESLNVSIATAIVCSEFRRRLLL